jgi:mono/diheme cytochrome c family protein
MKRFIISTFIIIAAALAVTAFSIPSGQDNNPPQDKAPVLFPEDVQKILETSCYDCHTEASSNAKAKMKLNISKWSEMSDAKKVGKMESISETIKSGEMPPAKYLEKFPEKALTQEQKDIVTKWVTEESNKLMGQ